MVQGGIVPNSWNEILATRYGHREAILECTLSCYSLHYFYHLADRRRRYVLSKVRKDENRIPFRFQFELLQRLSRRLDEVNEVVEPEGGTTSWVDTDHHYWFVRRRPENAVPAGGQDDDLIVPAARLLADVHEAAGGLWTEDRPPAFDADRLDPYYWSSVDVMEGIDFLVEANRLSRLPEADADLVRHAVKRLQDAPAAWESLGPFGLTHQDYRPENILFSKGDRKIIEVIDWDRARPDCQVFDAVLAALQFGWPAKGRFDQLRSNEFIQAYLKSRLLSVPNEALTFAFRLAAVKGSCVSRAPNKWLTVLQAVEQGC